MGDSEDTLKVTKGEVSGLVLLAIVGAGVVQALVTKLAERLFNLPEAISFALGFLALFACLIPAVRVLSRSSEVRAPSVGRLFAAAVLGSIVGGAIFWLLH